MSSTVVDTEKIREGSETPIGFPLSDGDGNGARLTGKLVEMVLVDKDENSEETRSFFNSDPIRRLTVGAVNQRQILQGPAGVSSGTFKLKYGSQTTSALNWNAKASEVQSALGALTGLSGKVQCSDGPLPAAITVEFVDSLFAIDQPLLLLVDDTVGMEITGKTIVTFQPWRTTFYAGLSPYRTYFWAYDERGVRVSYPEEEPFFLTLEVQPSYQVIR